MAQKNKVSPTGNDNDVAPQGKVTLAQLKHEHKPNGRLCGDLDKFIIHKESIKPSKHRMICKWCGEECYTQCGVCEMPCHDNPKKGDCKGKQCFIHLHSEMRFGLGRLDCALVKKDKKNWEEPTEDEIRENCHHIKERQRILPYNIHWRVTPQPNSST
jgi:hypothetical protein